MKLALPKYFYAVVLMILLVLSVVNIYLVLDQRLALRNAALASPYDYVIFRDGDLYKARNQATGNVDFSSNNAALVINQAIAEGDTIYIKPGDYSLNSDIQINDKKNAKITSDEAKIVCDGNKMVLKGENFTKSQNNLISGFVLVNGTVRIENSFGTTISNMIFVNCSTALELVNTETWTEGTNIENCRFENSLEGIAFRTPTGNATGSYASSKINRCFFNFIDNSIGIIVEQLAEFSDSQIQDVRLWMGESNLMYNQTGLLLEGSMHQTLMSGVVFESFADNPDLLYAMKFGENSITPPILSGGVSFLGNWTVKIHNPFNKWISGLGAPFKQENINIPIGMNGQYGQTIEIQQRPLTIACFKPGIKIQGNFLNNETLTVRFRLELIDNTITTGVEKSFQNSTVLWLSDDDILRMLPSQSVIWNILVDARTNSASTDASIKVSVYGTLV
jgi:hypothetical protein